MVAILGSLIFAAGVVVQQVGLESADTDVEQLDNFHDHATQLIAGQVLQGLGFALFAVTIYVLFRASSGRAERMRRSLLPLALIGPPLFLIAMILVSFGVRDIADQFVEERPAIEQQARQEAAAAQAPAEETPDERVEERARGSSRGPWPGLVDHPDRIGIAGDGDAGDRVRPDLHPALGDADGPPHPILGLSRDGAGGPRCCSSGCSG